MFSAVNKLLDIDEHHFPQEMFYLISESHNDGSFFLHHFLTYYLKAGYNVVFVALVQSFAHYSCVAQKLGVNLNAFTQNGKLVFVEGLKLALENLKTVDVTENNPLSYLTSKDPKFSLKMLYKMIESKICSLNEGHPYLMMIDDVSVFLSLGVSTVDIQDFLHYCQIAVFSPGRAGCMVILVHADANDEDSDEELLQKMLMYKCDVQLHVTGLKSGYCRDVHGQIEVINHRVALTRGCPSEKIVQYKITNKDVLIFAPGNSTAVL
ncbi:elongator complex protein 6-like isoform X1 [Xenia sp. Carnegie-2017]|uniref:elongator complex protein 6-like isoform X1 n=1 Tax=Xenia sp. Carnegie-2017 TaxID=2897299 RepID=UPI001F047A90|nr:elongator complex protein 6-like isoform X1 [Xenia sp. Carnegie-2017]